jgi:hypothetical protein
MNQNQNQGGQNQGGQNQGGQPEPVSKSPVSKASSPAKTASTAVSGSPARASNRAHNASGS